MGLVQDTTPDPRLFMSKVDQKRVDVQIVKCFCQVDSDCAGNAVLTDLWFKGAAHLEKTGNIFRLYHGYWREEQSADSLSSFLTTFKSIQ